MHRGASALLSGLLALGTWAPQHAHARGEDEPLGTQAGGEGAAVVADEDADVVPEAAAHVGVEAIILPTQWVVAPSPELAASLERRRSVLDALFTDAAQDLDLIIELTDAGALERSEIGEDDLVAFAEKQGKLVVLPLLHPTDMLGESFQLRVVAASPGSQVLRSRLTRVAAADLSVRAVAMLRDIVVDRPAGRSEWRRRPAPEELVSPARSRGRAILAINGALYGGFVGYSIQRASQSDDPRLLYPMVAVGAGVGLGATIIVADEWDVGAGDAWYLAAGAWWPAVAGHLLYEGRFGDTPGAGDDEAWSFGLVSSLTGMTLATVGLLPRGMGDGGAALAHSGGALGLVVGGLTEFAVTGANEEVPFSGMGYGVGIGWLLGATAAIQIHPDVTRVLTIDLGTMLGGLVGASAASPLLFDDPSATKTRGWVAAAGGGLLLGGGFAWWLSAADPPAEEVSDEAPPPEDGPAEPGAEAGSQLFYRFGLPQLGLVGGAPAPGEIAEPGWGVRWEGQLW